MIPGKKSRIYSEYEIQMILFYATMLLFVPNILVFTYIFEIDQYVDILQFIFWLLMSVLAITAFGTGFFLLRKDRLKRRVKPAYQSEFIYLLFISAFGLLGIAVLYDYLGGNRAYIANLLVVIFAFFVFMLITLGRKYFKFDYMKKK